MFARCYSELELKKYPSYKGCSISEEFIKFTDFKKWVDSQPNKDWENCHLDKDLLIKDNKVYSPDTCAFITADLNTFLTDSEASRGEYLIGVTYHKRDKVFEAKCNNPFGKTTEEDRYLGRYDTEESAHLAWKAKKHEYSCIFAEAQTDERVAKALLNLYKPD
jgi:hypothetical protein